MAKNKNVEQVKTRNQMLRQMLDEVNEQYKTEKTYPSNQMVPEKQTMVQKDMPATYRKPPFWEDQKQRWAYARDAWGNLRRTAIDYHAQRTIPAAVSLGSRAYDFSRRNLKKYKREFSDALDNYFYRENK